MIVHNLNMIYMIYSGNITNIRLRVVVDDVKLNSTMFHWPEHMSTVFEVSSKRLSSKRDHSEDDLRNKIQEFEEKLAKYYQEIENFRKKEVSVTGLRTLFSVLSVPRTVYSGQCTQDSVLRTVYSGQSTQDSVPRTVYTGQCTQNSVLRTVYSGQCTQDSVIRAVYSRQCT